jgi:hypothetical protein
MEARGRKLEIASHATVWLPYFLTICPRVAGYDGHYGINSLLRLVRLERDCGSLRNIVHKDEIGDQ